MRTFILVALVAMLLITGCCTKKMCTVPQNPPITVQFVGFADSDLANKVIYLADKNNFQLIDSEVEASPQTTDRILNYFNGRTIDLRQYNIIFKLQAGRRDTITGINYDLVTEKIKCNQCFPFGDGSSKVTVLQNVQFTYRDATYSTDSLSIIK